MLPYNVPNSGLGKRGWVTETASRNAKRFRVVNLCTKSIYVEQVRGNQKFVIKIEGKENVNKSVQCKNKESGKCAQIFSM